MNEEREKVVVRKGEGRDATTLKGKGGVDVPPHRKPDARFGSSAGGNALLVWIVWYVFCSSMSCSGSIVGGFGEAEVGIIAGWHPAASLRVRSGSGISRKLRWRTAGQTGSAVRRQLTAVPDGCMVRQLRTPRVAIVKSTVLTLSSTGIRELAMLLYRIVYTKNIPRDCTNGSVVVNSVVMASKNLRHWHHQP
jgi:hypothetical protein